MMKLDTILEKRKQYITDRQFVNILSALVGLLAGFGAVIIKNTVFLIHGLLKTESLASFQHYFYFIYPLIGIALVLFFIRFLIHNKVEHGIPGVLYSIAETKGHIKLHNLYSSILTASLTVGFGGSVGLEGPTVATGAAYGSFLGRTFRLNYKQIIILLGAACTAAMSAIFKAPVTGIVFALEVIMIDLTIASVLPLLIASVTAILTSYFFLGTNVLYHFELHTRFTFSQLGYYVLLGIAMGLLSVYFTKVYIFIQSSFKKVRQPVMRLIYAGISLGVLIFLFPALYGEGYEVINQALSGNAEFIWQSSILKDVSSNIYIGFFIILAVILLKTFATSLTFAAGGVGGIFAPTLFMGSLSGLLFALVFKYLGYDLPAENFALAAMAGSIAGVLQAPLTAIFLIAEISGGYQLIVPLMIVALISYITSRIFIRNSVYTYQLAQRGHLLTHHTDRNTLRMLDLDKIIETDFIKVSPTGYLRDLVEAISHSNRNIFPVVDESNNLLGVVSLADVRDIMFKPRFYDKVKITELMHAPSFTVTPNDTMEDIAHKLEQHHIYNIPVIEDGHYKGFISRANFFGAYRSLLKEFSEE